MSQPDKSDGEYLEVWEVPFAQAAYPALTPIMSPEEPGPSRKDRFPFKVIVFPHGFGKHPGYVVEFVRAHYVMYHDEACGSHDSHWLEVIKQSPKSCAYIWHGSSLLQRYEGIGCEFEETLRHYVLLGGDWVIEVLSYREPTVTKFDGPLRIPTDYSS